jgi:hypothetical protein
MPLRNILQRQPVCCPVYLIISSALPPNMERRRDFANLGSLAMVKLCATGILGCLIVFAMAATAFAQAPPPNPPGIRYQLPPDVTSYPADRLPEGRSVYRSEDPSRFPNHVDERGYQSGMPENPQF